MKWHSQFGHSGRKEDLFCFNLAPSEGGIVSDSGFVDSR